MNSYVKGFHVQAQVPLLLYKKEDSDNGSGLFPEEEF